MTVYELIQELTQFDANKKIEFRFEAKFDTDVKAEFNRDSEDDIQEVTVEASFDDTIEYYDLNDDKWNKNNVIMTFSY